MALFSSPTRVDGAAVSTDQAADLARISAHVRAHPHDLKARRALGDVHAAAGRTRQAIGEYQALAGAYAAQGNLFRAIATSKLIIALDVAHRETHQVLANLYARQGVVPGAESVNVELPASMGAALVVDMEDVVDSSACSPPVPLDISDDVGADGAAPVDDKAVVAAASIDDDDDGDIVNADTLAALTVRPEGSVVLARPAAVPLFSGLSASAFAWMLSNLKAWEADAGAVIVAEGEVGDSLFVIARGRVRIERQGKDGAVVVGYLGEGDFFGEIALMDIRPRAASVIAEQTTELLEVSRANIDELVALDANVRVVLDAFCAERLKKSVLLTSPLFEGLSSVLLGSALAQFEERRVNEGDVIVTVDQPSTGLFVVLSGSVDVVVKAELGWLPLKQLGVGDVFGEMSLLSGAGASAAVIAASSCRVLVLPAAAFSLLAAEPELSARLAALSWSRAEFNARFLPAAHGARTGSL